PVGPPQEGGSPTEGRRGNARGANGTGHRSGHQGRPWRLWCCNAGRCDLGRARLRSTSHGTLRPPHAPARCLPPTAAKAAEAVGDITVCNACCGTWRFGHLGRRQRAMGALRNVKETNDALFRFRTEWQQALIGRRPPKTALLQLLLSVRNWS